MIGTFGPVVFVASDEVLKTFDNFVRHEQGRWTKHDIIGKKPKPEFLGPDLGSISFTMRFDVAFGMNPRKEMDNLLSMVRDGKYYTLVIGGKGLGVNKWSLQSVTQNWRRVDNRGNILVGEVTVELEEYV